MPPAHRKLRRKELKEPDEFTAFIENAEDWIVRNLTQVMVAASVVAVVALGIMGVHYYQRHYDRVTAEQFYDAFNAFSGKQYKVAESRFMELAAAQPERELGRLARFYLAQCYLAENDLTHARDSLAAFIAESRDPNFRQLALHTLAVVYEKMGDFKKAEGAYREAAAIPGPEQADSDLSVARILAREGDKRGAIAAYRSFLEERPFAPQRPGVIEALAELGAPVEVGSTAAAPR